MAQTTRRNPVGLLTVPLTAILVHALGVLPAQIRWAETHVSPKRAEGLPGGTLEPLEALRLLTVSPVWRLGEAAGGEALLTEAVWTSLFALFLLAASTVFTGRTDLGVYRTLRACVPLVVLAPLAGLAALMVTRLPLFLREQPQLESSKFSSPVHGYTPLTETLQDAYQIAPHTALLGLSAAVVLLAVKGTRWCTSAHAPGARRATLLLLALLRGPVRTVWRRIGETVLVTGTATTALHLLTSPDLAKAVRPLLDGRCSSRFCANELTQALLRPRPRLFPHSEGVEILTETFLRPWAYECFALLFALTFFGLRSLPGLRTRPMRARALFLLCLAGFISGSVAANTSLLLYTDALFGAEPLHTFSGLLLHSPGMHDALYAGPATAFVTTAGASALRALARGTSRLRGAGGQVAAVTDTPHVAGH
ncbi:hypothetical protein ACIREO_21820 [Streptomyces sp. NPDC102441]|uniref:hypothetical protein n=1 Tax=Streptomyces sp. NPDC102441 TaxID=3366176 RepID=UPI00381B15A0